MEMRQYRTLQSFTNVLWYLEKWPIVPEPPLLTGMKRKLAAIVERINKLAGSQVYARRTKGANVTERRRRLRRERMMPLVRIARPLLRYAPGVEAKLTVPHARANPKVVAEAALDMVKALRPHAKLLKSAGYSKTFLAEFRAEAVELRDIAKLSANGRARHTAVTRQLAEEFRKGMQTVEVIEGLVMLHSKSDKRTYELWRNRRRVGARIGRPKKRKSKAPAFIG